jgi:hypothetical protein
MTLTLLALERISMISVPALCLDSAGWLNLRAAQEQGAVAVGLYVMDNLTTAIAQEAADLNMGLWSFNERWPGDPNEGAEQGIIDATEWCHKADQVSQPEGAGTWMPNDQEGITNPIIEYFHAGAETILSCGRTPAFYGQSVVWEQVKGYGFKYFCHAPDGDEPPYPDANIVQSRWPEANAASNIQIYGVSCDVDTLMTLDFGGWNADGLWPLLPSRKEPSVFTFKDPNSGDQYICLGKGKVNCFHLSPKEFANCQAAGLPHLTPDAALYAWIMS